MRGTDTLDRAARVAVRQGLGSPTRRLRLADLALVVLMLGTAALVLRDLDLDAPPTASVTAVDPEPSGSVGPTPTASASPVGVPQPVERAVIALSAAESWRWTGAAECDTAHAPRVLEKSADGRTWSPTRLPIPWVADVAVGPGLMVAVGKTADCSAALSVSTDNGAQWSAPGGEAEIVSVDVVADALWVVDSRGVVRTGKSVNDLRAVAIPACSGADAGPGSLVDALSARQALVVCQRADGSGRLLVYTGDGGASWRRYAGKRVESGLAGGRRIDGFSMAEGGIGLALVRGAACPQGEVRLTSDGGTQWRTLPCAAGPQLKNILAIGLRSAREALAVGTDRLGRLETWSSADAGATWRKV